MKNDLIYPIDMCETCIREIDDLVTSGEMTEARERLDDLEFNGSDCQTCIRLACGLEVA
jgi:hypothetical protein